MVSHLQASNRRWRHVRKGEHGYPICFVKDLVVKNEDNEDEESYGRVLKRYIVFNVAQCDGLPEKLAAPPLLESRHRDGRDPTIEEFFTSIGVQIIKGNAAPGYSVKTDTVALPPFETFSSDTYYVTAFHETGHWIGVSTSARIAILASASTKKHMPPKSSSSPNCSAPSSATEFSVNGSFQASDPSDQARSHVPKAQPTSSTLAMPSIGTGSRGILSSSPTEQDIGD